MVREKKFANVSGAKETPAGKFMETIIEDVINTGAMTFAEWHALSANPFAPLAIPISQGRQYQVTQVGVNAADMLTNTTWKSREDLRQTIDRKAFRKLSFQAIGDTLSDCPSRLLELPDDWYEQDEVLGDDFYTALLEYYQVRLQELATSSSPDLDWHIPCHIFNSNQDVPAFAVGPVRFLPRAEWVNSFVKDSEVRELIRQVETRELEMEELITQSTAAESNHHGLHAVDVLRTLHHYSWVATIRMERHEYVQSHFKASMVVGLAIDAIGLRFHIEDARRFTKVGRQHLFAEDRLATTLDGKLFRGSSVQMPGIGSRPGALSAKMLGEQPFLDAAGCILQHYIDGRRNGHALHLVERWANALYWVGEARRESYDFMAVVNYGCAADGLSGAGGTAKEMIRFAEAALKPEGGKLPKGAFTVNDAVHKVYREGRNKLAHGEMSGLLEDLAEPRAIGEALLLALFDVVTPVLSDLLQNEPNLPKLDEKHAYRLLEAKLAANIAKT